MAMTLIATNPDSTDVDVVSFTSSIDSTYKLYIFKWYDVNPATDNAKLTFQANVVGASGYNETITSTYFVAYHDEADENTDLQYETDKDQAQGTAFQPLTSGVGNAADESCAGELYLFNPSNTTYVKHFYARVHEYYHYSTGYSISSFIAGYFNVTGAIDDIQFKMSTGNMDAVIKMYGVG